ncbi:MAG: putative zinc-binding protein [archaeon]|nr:putative zinc-binding protein [archaeon]
MVDKIALAPCNGMSPNGLVSHVACGDARKENENVISICMGSTSADIEGANNEMLKRFPIIAVNGCSGMCVNKILESKGIDVIDTIPVFEILKNACLVATDAFRLSEVEEECVKVIKQELIKELKK